MAAVVTVTKFVAGDRLGWRVKVVETNADNAQEVLIDGGFPPEGTIPHFESTLLAGAGATINSMLGKNAAFVENTEDHIATNSKTDARINDNASVQYGALEDGTMYLRNNVNAGADNAITTEFTVLQGHVAA